MAQAVLTKEADVESRRIEASERHTKFLHMVLQCDADSYASATSEPLNTSLQAFVQCSREELQDLTDFGSVAYNHDVTSFAVAYEQFSDMENYARQP